MSVRSALLKIPAPLPLPPDAAEPIVRPFSLTQPVFVPAAGVHVTLPVVNIASGGVVETKTSPVPLPTARILSSSNCTMPAPSVNRAR